TSSSNGVVYSGIAASASASSRRIVDCSMVCTPLSNSPTGTASPGTLDAVGAGSGSTARAAAAGARGAGAAATGAGETAIGPLSDSSTITGGVRGSEGARRSVANGACGPAYPARLYCGPLRAPDDDVSRVSPATGFIDVDEMRPDA